MPQVHVFGDLKRRTELEARESAALQRAKRDERLSPLSRGGSVFGNLEISIKS